jgi:hypothetical protein
MKMTWPPIARLFVTRLADAHAEARLAVGGKFIFIPPLFVLYGESPWNIKGGRMKVPSPPAARPSP